MGNIIIQIIGLLVAALGVKMIFDARVITKQAFSFGDQNEATSGLKILGFILSIIGILIFYFNM